MTYLKQNKIKTHNSYIKKLDVPQKNCLVAIEKERYEYIKRLLILYKAQLRQTGECHYPSIVEMANNKKR